MIRYLMTRLGRLSLPSFPRTFPNSRANQEKILVNVVTTFHLWCSSNSLHDDSICLRLFQCTLIGPAVKWYIELPKGEFILFDDLAMTFLNHFQLPVHYDVGTEFLLTFRQDKATHILGHIQEWRRWKMLIKAFIPSEFLLEWFLKLFLPYIMKDVSTSGV